jgi:hypothetical protein
VDLRHVRVDLPASGTRAVSAESSRSAAGWRGMPTGLRSRSLPGQVG